MPTGDHDVHTVVFDVNVYVDMAECLGLPATWDRFVEKGEELINERKKTSWQRPFHDRSVDSLLALWHVKTGYFAGEDRLAVITSNHIDSLVVEKVQERLGWTEDQAMDLLYDVIYELIWGCTDGTTLGDEPNYSTFHPPLDWEDGRVYQLACSPGEEYVWKHCVTNDRPFRTAQVRGSANLYYPHEWIEFVRRSRSAFPVRR